MSCDGVDQKYVYGVLHNRGIGTLKQSVHKYNKRENPEKDSFTSLSEFFFKASVLAAKEILPGDNLFLLPTLRDVDKLRCLLFDRNVSQVHSLLKNAHDLKLTVGHFALTDNFVSCFCISTFSSFLTKKPSSENHWKTPEDTLI